MKSSPCGCRLRMSITIILVLQICVVLSYLTIIQSPWIQNAWPNRRNAITTETGQNPPDVTESELIQTSIKRSAFEKSVGHPTVQPLLDIVHRDNSHNISEWITSLARQNKSYEFASNLGDWFRNSFTTRTAFQFSRPVELSSNFLTAENGRLTCYMNGTDLKEDNTKVCHCRHGWEGKHCSIPPEVVYSSASIYLDNFELRPKARRVVQAIAFNIEFDFLEIKLNELRDLVDVFIIYESNYTLYGDAKPLRLLEKLTTGFLEEFHHKILYLFLGKFPRKSYEDGWYAERYQRMYIGRTGMKHIVGLNQDDIFMYLDADEIPTKDSLEFLKHHNGYPEPFGYSLRWSVYGFFWKQNSETNIIAGCSLRMFRYVYSNDVQKLRSNDFNGLDPSVMRSYLKEQGGTFQSWLFSEQNEAHRGWHCSWCFKSEYIRIKLTSAVNADFPRWGDYPNKLNIDYIKRLVQTGTWFDDVTTYQNLVSNNTDPNFAPEYVLQNSDKFGYMLDKTKTT